MGTPLPLLSAVPAAAVAWQFTAADHERRERAALRIIAVIAANEGRDTCCAPTTALTTEPAPGGCADGCCTSQESR